ncbi:MAG: hypothetical protein ACLUQ6_02125 [Alistipes onderdonkii]
MAGPGARNGDNRSTLPGRKPRGRKGSAPPPCDIPGGHGSNQILASCTRDCSPATRPAIANSTAFDFTDADADCRFGRDTEGYLLTMTPRDGSAPARFHKAFGSPDATSDITPEHNPALFRFGLWTMFNIAALERRAVAVHSSVISLDGRAVLFLGESGTGKEHPHAPVARAYPRGTPAQRRQPDHPDRPRKGCRSGKRSRGRYDSRPARRSRLRVAVERQNPVLPQRKPSDSGHRAAFAGTAEPHPPPASHRSHRGAAAFVPAVVRTRRAAGRRHLPPRIPNRGASPRLPPRMPARCRGSPSLLPHGIR